MNDTKIIELAARSAINAGINITPDWNPLENDSDAVIAASRLGIDISFDYTPSNYVIATSRDSTMTYTCIEPTGDDIGQAIRRAITRAAAAIGNRPISIPDVYQERRELNLQQETQP